MGAGGVVWRGGGFPLLVGSWSPLEMSPLESGAVPAVSWEEGAGTLGFVEKGHFRVGVAQEFLGACGGHVEEPAFLFVVFACFGHGAGDLSVAGTEDDDIPPFQSFGGVDGGDGDAIFWVFLGCLLACAVVVEHGAEGFVLRAEATDFRDAVLSIDAVLRIIGREELADLLGKEESAVGPAHLLSLLDPFARDTRLARPLG